ncbi:MAG TPA: phosphoesterase [Calditrichaeota bacterium]|nr:phosphoesterase [Calditrichota bacterium]
MMNSKERVLVVERDRVPAAWLPEFGFVALSQKQFQKEINRWPLLFLPRDRAEDDEAYKQIIPYTVLLTDGGHLLCYQRKGTEKRLNELFSAGVGGHVNEESDRRATFWETLRAGLRRELQEECGLASSSIAFRGIINEHKTRVGRVHLGAVFSVTLERGQIETLPLSEELDLHHICSIETFLSQKKYEYWSGLALQLLVQE